MLISVDLCGRKHPSADPSTFSFLRMIIFRHIYFLRHIDNIFEKFKEFERFIFNRFERRIKTVRSDNETELKNERMYSYMTSRSITSAPYVHERNGRAEREMRTIIESARTMLTAKNLSTKLWAEAVNTAVYILNRCLSFQTDNVTPFEIWYKGKSELSHIRIFGSDAYAHIPKEQRKNGVQNQRSSF